MAKQVIDIGTAALKGKDGDSNRTANTKNNSNHTELYNALGADQEGNLPQSLPIAKGGTGATNLSDARSNLGLSRFKQDADFAMITSQNGLASIVIADCGWGINLQAGAESTGFTRALQMDNGGTGASTAEAARTNLGLGAVATENIIPITKGGTGTTSAEAAAHALACIGAGQKFMQKKAERAVDITYANTTGRVMLVCVRIDAPITGLGGLRLAAYSGPFLVWQSWGTQTKGTAFMMAVENGASYSLKLLEGSLQPDFKIEEWMELR